MELIDKQKAIDVCYRFNGIGSTWTLIKAEMEKIPPVSPHRITIRDIVDLLDYDRTGIRTLRIVDDDTKQSDMLRTDSYLMQYIEGTAVNTLDTVNGVITLYVDYKGGETDG